MKREQLKELGLTDEQMGSVMALHGQTVTDLNKALASAEQERDQFKGQLKTNQEELDKIKDSVKDNEDLTKQLSELQTKFDESKTILTNNLLSAERFCN
ncbi:phage scaffolding protein [Enterococcus termitis]